MSDARDKAIAVICEKWREIRSWHRGSDEEYFGDLLDAIPSDVLAAYAIERGAVVQVDKWSSSVHRGIPLYRLATEDDR